MGEGDGIGAGTLCVRVLRQRSRHTLKRHEADRGLGFSPVCTSSSLGLRRLHLSSPFRQQTRLMN